MESSTLSFVTPILASPRIHIKGHESCLSSSPCTSAICTQSRSEHVCSANTHTGFHEGRVSISVRVSVVTCSFAVFHVCACVCVCVCGWVGVCVSFRLLTPDVLGADAEPFLRERASLIWYQSLF